MTCGHALAWYDNIPLVSFSVLRGKCRHCAASLSWQYPIIEGVTALVFILIAVHSGITWMTVFAWGIGMMMISIAVYDARWSLLPDNFSYALAGFGAVYAILQGVAWPELLLGAAAGLGFFGAQFTLSRGRWVGSGDIFLGGALGVFLGWRMLGLALLLSYFIGALVAAILLLTKKQTSQSSIPFGPYLVLGGFFAWLYGQQIIDWYFNHAIFR
jgi:prepilin signal peptidase PulO-like enzyme (type II secretory pathway)